MMTGPLGLDLESCAFGAMTSLNNIELRHFEPSMQDEVRDLISAGLAERFGLNDPSRNPDLFDIDSAYSDATFIVACANTRIIGTGALVQEDQGTGRIVRMSVESSWRRKGVGALILGRLVDAAEALRYRRIVLETTADWKDAVCFYRSRGFSLTGIDRLRNEAQFELRIGAVQPRRDRKTASTVVRKRGR